jgi:hypothetical protein
MKKLIILFCLLFLCSDLFSQSTIIVPPHKKKNTAVPLVGFETEWVVSGDATARTITLPLVNTRTEGALTYDCVVDWGDGTATSHVTAYDDANRIHTYTANGTYDVTITGTMEGWSFNNSGDKLKITKVLNWGDANLFDGFKYLKGGFWGCVNLNSISSGGILASGDGVMRDGFAYTFFNTPLLTTIPADLFKNHVAVDLNAFEDTFAACGLMTIPTDLFKYNVNVGQDGFYGTFYYCLSLTTVPTDLFKYNINCQNFNSCFEHCPSLVSIPNDLFRYCPLVSSDGFLRTFIECSSLISIPIDLFRYNTAVCDDAFEECFKDCNSLATIPANLFKYNTRALNFVSTFQNCISLQLNANIFYADGEQATRFLNQSVNFTNCFNRSTFTGIQGTAPDLWNCNFGTSTPTTSACFYGAGNSPTSISNYTDIPAGWK